MQKIQFISPISIKDAQRATIMLKSINKFFEPESLESLVLLVPDKELFENLIKSLNLNFPVEIIKETDIIPEKDLKKYNAKTGWIKQQLLKMMAAHIVRTKFYLCLDADVICFKKADYQSLVRAGKPITTIEPKSKHLRWWKDSAYVLRIPESKSNRGIGATPSILIKDEVINMMNHIEKTYKRSFINVLCNWWWTESYFLKRNWTEYSLYWSYLEYSQKSSLHSDEEDVYGKSIWKSDKSDITEETFKTIFSQRNTGYFTVCQSTRIPDSTVFEMAAKYLGVN